MEKYNHKMRKNHWKKPTGNIGLKKYNNLTYLSGHYYKNIGHIPRVA